MEKKGNTKINEIKKVKFKELEYLNDSLFSDSNIQLFKKLELLYSSNDIELIQGFQDIFNYESMEIEN